MKNKIKNIFKSIGIILLLLCFNSVMFSIFNINLKSLSEKEYLIYTVLFELVLLISLDVGSLNLFIYYIAGDDGDGDNLFYNYLYYLSSNY